MKAKYMPKKIYLLDYNEAMVTPLEGDTTYVREDAFIEKAAEWLMENVEKHISADGEYTVYYNEMVEDFKKAMML